LIIKKSSVTSLYFNRFREFLRECAQLLLHVILRKIFHVVKEMMSLRVLCVNTWSIFAHT